MLFMLSDAYYYSSLAESLSQFGTLYSLTSIPELPIVTTQNGIVFFHYFLIKLGDYAPVDRAYILSGVCFLVILAIMLLLKKLHLSVFKRGGFETLLVLLIIAFNTTWHTSLLQPINDVFFIFLVFLYIYIFFNNELVFPKKLFYFILISIFISHFRIQGAFVFFTAAFVCAYFKMYTQSVIHLLLLGLSFTSVWFMNLFLVDDYSGLGGVTEYFVNNLSVNYLFTNVNTLINSTLPVLFFGTKKLSQYYSFFFVIILFVVFISGIKAFSKKDKQTIFLSLFIFFNVTFVVVFPSQTARYLLVLLPFFIIVCLDYLSEIRVKHWVLSSYVVILFLLISYRVCLVTPKTSLDEGIGIHFDIDYSLNEENSKIFLQRYGHEYDLVTETYQGRVTYFLFSKASVNNQKTKNENIIYAGTSKSYGYFRSSLMTAGVKILSENKSDLRFNLSHHLYNDSEIFLIKVLYTNVHSDE